MRAPGTEWLLRMADLEGNGICSVGGLICEVLKGEYHPVGCTHTVTPNTGETQLDDHQKRITGATTPVVQVQSEA